MKNIFFVLMLMFSATVFAQKKIINQTVDAACGMCQFKQKNGKDCAMAVKIDGKLYYVEGVDENAFGDAHAHDGYCNQIKKAVVSGEIRKGKFYATRFKYVPKKN